MKDLIGPLLQQFKVWNIEIIYQISLKSQDDIIELTTDSITRFNLGIIIISQNFIEMNWKRSALEFITDLEKTKGRLIHLIINLTQEDLNPYHHLLGIFPSIQINNITELKTITTNQIMDLFVKNYRKLSSEIEELNFTDVEEVEISTLNSLKSQIKIAIFTAVAIERKFVLKYMIPLDGRKFILQCFMGERCYYLGKLGAYNIVLVETGKGVQNSLLACEDTYRDFKIKIGILCGIAFGAKPISQMIGDVLISTMVIDYEKEKIGDKTEFLGPKNESSISLLTRFSNKSGWIFYLTEKIPSKIIPGAILSGDKLVNNLDFRMELLEKHSDAIGGEMEGCGFSRSSIKNKVDWIIIKSICDWATKKNDDFQELAAECVTDFLNYVLESELTFREIIRS